MRLFEISVERAPTQKPIYYLVFGTRNPLGLWHFADDTARATETWWSTLDAQEAAKEEEADVVPLFDICPPPSRRAVASPPGATAASWEPM